MQLTIIFATFFAVSLAAPSKLAIVERQIGNVCQCVEPICPMELVAVSYGVWW